MLEVLEALWWIEARHVARHVARQVAPSLTASAEARIEVEAKGGSRFLPPSLKASVSEDEMEESESVEFATESVSVRVLAPSLETQEWKRLVWWVGALLVAEERREALWVVVDPLRQRLGTVGLHIAERCRDHVRRQLASDRLQCRCRRHIGMWIRQRAWPIEEN